MTELRVTISLLNKPLPMTINVVQGDSGRKIRFFIDDAEFPDGATAKIFAIKPSKLIVFNELSVERRRELLLELTDQMVAEAGTLPCQITIYSENKIISSFEFSMCVNRQIRNDSAIESTNEFTALTVAINRAEKAVSDANSLRNEYIPKSYMDAAMGVAALDEYGLIKISQMPTNIRVSAANMADRLTWPRRIDGVDFDGTEDISHHAICNTSASEAAKIANFYSDLHTTSGARLIVYFVEGNTASNPTISIGNTAALPIYYKGSPVSPGLITEKSHVELICDGTRYNIVGDLAQAKINELESMLSVTDITSSFSPSTDKISISKAYKYGKLVIVHGFLVAGYAQGWHTTETITTSYPPLTNASFIMGSQNSGDQTTGIKLDYRPSGTVYGTVSAALTGNNLFQLIYFTA